jgi:hypothetical protein
MHSHVFSLFSKKEFAEKNPRSYSEPCYCISSPLFAVTVAGEYLEPGLGPTSWPHEEKCWAYIYTLLCVGMWEIAIARLPWANQTNLVQPSSTRSTAPECVRCWVRPYHLTWSFRSLLCLFPVRVITPQTYLPWSKIFFLLDEDLFLNSKQFIAIVICDSNNGDLGCGYETLPCLTCLLYRGCYINIAGRKTISRRL